MDAKTYRKAQTAANKAIAALPTYTADFSEWLGKAEAILEAVGLDVDTSGIYCGETGSANWPIEATEGRLGFHFQWYKMGSGRYEMTAYVS